MTNRTNARLAGFTFLFYIAVGVTHMVLSGQATRGAEGAATLASIARHAPLMRVTVLLTLLEAFSALTLGVTLWALTRDADRDLAVMALCCRAGEGMVGVLSASRTVQLLGLASGTAGAAPTDAAAANALGALLLNGGGAGGIAATCFGVGSTLFCYLFLRARSIPLPLAWLGLVASAIWVVALPLQVAGFVHGPVITYFVYIPMAVFEVTLALWLLVKGVAVPPHATGMTGSPGAMRVVRT